MKPPNTLRPVTFTLNTWKTGVVQRRSFSCDRCGYVASLSGGLDTAAPEAEHKAATANHTCPPAVYAWDYWRREAFERGMAPATADAGRALIREHHNHGWGTPIDPDRMMERGLKAPKAARRRWLRLLDPEGIS